MGTTQKPSDVYLEVQKAFENGLEKRLFTHKCG